MKFCDIEIGDRWSCPWCGTKSLVKLSPCVAECRKCARIFKVLIKSYPDPNSKTSTKECGSKKPHTTIESAFKHADELKEIPNRYRKNLCIYKCRFCHNYHVGHKGKVARSNNFFLYTELKAQYERQIIN